MHPAAHTVAPARGQTARFRLSVSRHVCDLSGDGVKEFVTEGDPDEYERPEQTDISSDYRQKAKNKVQIGDQKHLTVLKG